MGRLGDIKRIGKEVKKLTEKENNMALTEDGVLEQNVTTLGSLQQDIRELRNDLHRLEKNIQKYEENTKVLKTLGEFLDKNKESINHYNTLYEYTHERNKTNE